MQQAFPPAEMVHSVGFTLTLQDMTPAGFTELKQAAFATDLADSLGLEPKQVEIAGYTAGSLIVETRVLGLKDAATAQAMATHVEAKTSQGSLLSADFGPCVVANIEAKVVQKVASRPPEQAAWRKLVRRVSLDMVDQIMVVATSPRTSSSIKSKAKRLSTLPKAPLVKSSSFRSKSKKVGGIKFADDDLLNDIHEFRNSSIISPDDLSEYDPTDAEVEGKSGGEGEADGEESGSEPAAGPSTVARKMSNAFEALNRGMSRTDLPQPSGLRPSLKWDPSSLPNNMYRVYTLTDALVYMTIDGCIDEVARIRPGSVADGKKRASFRSAAADGEDGDGGDAENTDSEDDGELVTAARKQTLSVSYDDTPTPAPAAATASAAFADPLRALADAVSSQPASARRGTSAQLQIRADAMEALFARAMIDTEDVVEACEGGLEALLAFIATMLGQSAADNARIYVGRQELDDESAVDLLGDALIEGNMEVFLSSTNDTEKRGIDVDHLRESVNPLDVSAIHTGRRHTGVVLRHAGETQSHDPTVGWKEMWSEKHPSQKSITDKGEHDAHRAAVAAAEAKEREQQEELHRAAVLLQSRARGFLVKSKVEDAEFNLVKSQFMIASGGNAEITFEQSLDFPDVVEWLEHEQCDHEYLHGFWDDTLEESGKAEEGGATLEMEVGGCACVRVFTRSRQCARVRIPDFDLDLDLL